MQKKKDARLLIPVFGTIVFILLYAAAAALYPGGSQADYNATGFSWVNNYWCHLLNEKAINGKDNPAQPVALTGMSVLCMTLILFWYFFPIQTGMRKFTRLVIQLSGAAAMTTAFFLFTRLNHDLITNLACFFGGIALIGTFAGLLKMQWYALFYSGLLNLLLTGVNKYFYHHKELIGYLPVIQKISFATFLSWICCIAIKLYRRSGTISIHQPGTET